MIRIAVFAVAALMLTASAISQEEAAKRSGFDIEPLRTLPVLDGQRFKPFDSLAREAVLAITGKSRFGDVDPVLLYLEWLFDSGTTKSLRVIKLPAAEAANAIDLDIETSGSHIAWDELAAHDPFTNRVAAAINKVENARDQIDNALLRLHGRWALLGRIAGLGHHGGGEGAGYLPTIPPDEEMQPGVLYRWASPESDAGADETSSAFLAAYAALGQSWRADDAEAFAAATDGLASAAASLPYPKEFTGPAAMQREVRLNGVNPFFWTAYLYALATFLAMIALVAKGGTLRRLAIAVAAAGVLLHAWGMWERTALSGQALIGNLYESLLFVALVSVLMASILELQYPRRWFILAGGLLGALSLAVAISSADFMNPKITTLRPVLINNFWIHIHVPTIMASYAALALAFVLGHIYLIRYVIRPAQAPQMKELARFTYAVIPIGVALLFAGMILGGVWADASWGRFWGWDPKETWSFITWIVFLVIIHGRWAGWLRDFGVALGTMVGGWALLWTYYGVNFFQSGLHSYAGASAAPSVPMWLWIFSGFEFLLLVAAVERRQRVHSRSGTEHPEPSDSETLGAQEKGMESC